MIEPADISKVKISEGIKDQEAYTLLQNPYGFSGVGNRHEPKGIKGTITGRSFDDEQ